jgi:ABC-type glycerol-3-phosphate transport system substrate-binding protein
MKKLLLLLLILAAAGCRGSGPGGADTRPTPISAPAAAEGGGSADQGGGVGQDITLRLWTQDNESFVAAYQGLADAYMAANPGVSITLESFDVSAYGSTVLDALTAGTAADLVQMTGGTLCIYSPKLAAAPQPILDLNPQAAFDPLVLGGFICDGALFGLPQETSLPWGLVVSKSSAAADVAWDFVRFAALDPANAAQWNETTDTLGANRN